MALCLLLASPYLSRSQMLAKASTKAPQEPDSDAFISRLVVERQEYKRDMHANVLL